LNGRGAHVMLVGMLATARSAAVVATAAALAAGAAMACNHSGKGRKLAAAGTPQDDGSGILAKASVKFMTTSDEGGFEPDQQGARGSVYGYGYGYDYGGGFGYGGEWFGAHGYGGSPYASWQPYMPYNPVNRTPDYAIAYSNDGGAIEGRVTWPKPPKLPATVAAPAGCGEGSVANPSLRLASGNSVEGAVVYLERITSGKAMTQPYGGLKPITTGGTVELRGCALTPRVQVYIPTPGAVLLVNGSDAPAQLALEKVGDTASRVERRLDAGGSRATALGASGVYRINDVNGGLAPAWIVAGSHPYYAMTDDQGRFRLDDVSPGEYTLVVWHPPAITGVKDGVVQHGEPVVVTKKVVVKKTSATKIEVQIP
jgi:hypothetical protein